jgi:uncharacterized protein
MRVIDCHTHIFPPEVQHRRETFCMMDVYFSDLYENPAVKIATVDDLLTEMDQSGVDMSVMCGFGWSSHDLCVMQNDYLLDCARRFPDRLAALAVIQPLEGERAIHEAERCIAAGARGIGELMPDGQGYGLNELPRIGHLFEYAAERSIPVMTHASEPVGHEYLGKQAVTPGTIWPLVQAYPDTKFILSHWGGGYPFYELMPDVKAASVNVYYDSAASTYLYRHEIFLHVAQIVGHEKLLWGSDYPILRQGRFLQRVRELPMPGDTMEAILGKNTARLLALPCE